MLFVAFVFFICLFSLFGFLLVLAFVFLLLVFVFISKILRVSLGPANTSLMCSLAVREQSVHC